MKNLKSYLVSGLTAVMGLCGIAFIAMVPFPYRGVLAGLIFAALIYTMAWYTADYASRVEVEVHINPAPVEQHGKLV